MCWIGKESDIRVSKEDIKVFKVLYTQPKGWRDSERGFIRHYLAPYYPKYYYLNFLYTSEIVTIKRLVSAPSSRKDIPFGGRIDINRAIHCYSSSCKWDLTCDNLLTVSNLHYCRLISHYPLRKTERENLVVAVVEGIIPAGTEYWENESGEIATSRLILNNVKYMYNEKRK